MEVDAVVGDPHAQVVDPCRPNAAGETSHPGSLGVTHGIDRICTARPGANLDGYEVAPVSGQNVDLSALEVEVGSEDPQTTCR